MKKIAIHNQNLLIFFIFFIAYFFCVSNLLIDGKPIGYDDPIIIDPLFKVHSLKDYFELRDKLKIWDIQPVRDLSYIIDIQIKKRIPFWSFYHSHFLYWIFTLVCFFLFIKEFLIKYSSNYHYKNLITWSFFLGLIFFTNPIYQLGPLWLSSRKHILSALFIFIAGYFTVKYSEKIRTQLSYVFFISFFYGLSVFSQPITILFPVFVFFVLIFENNLRNFVQKNIILLFIALGSITLTNAYLNYVFYHKTYPLMNEGHGYKLVLENIWQVRLLGLGRFFYQFFDFTMASPIEHDRGNIRNIIGLLCLPPFLYYCYKKIPFRFLFLSFLWFLLPLSVVLLGDVKLFALDTYLIIASFGIFSLFGYLLHKKEFNPFYFLIIIPLLYETQKYSYAFGQNLRLARYATEKEETNFGYYSLATSLLSNGYSDEAFEKSYILSKLSTNFKQLEYLLPMSLIGAKRIPHQRKAKILKEWNFNSFYTTFYYSTLLSPKSQEFRKAQDLLPKQVDSTFQFPDINGATIMILAFYINHCEEKQRRHCLDQVESIRKRAPEGFWNDKAFLYYFLKTAKEAKNFTNEKATSIIQILEIKNPECIKK